MKRPLPPAKPVGRAASTAAGDTLARLSVVLEAVLETWCAALGKLRTQTVRVFTRDAMNRALAKSG